MTGFYGDDETYLNYFADKNPLAFYGFSSFDNLIEFVSIVDRLKIQSTEDRAAGWSRGSPKFYGTATFSEALDLAKNGWVEGAEKAHKITELMTVDHAQKKARVYSTVGGSVNIPKMLSGNPMHMKRKAKRDKIKTVTVFVNCAMLAAVSQEISNFKASVICGVVDLIERNGYSCELIAITTSNTRNNRAGFQSATILKNAGEKLNIENVVFALGHTAFFRRICFSLNGMAKECKPLWSYMGVTAQSFNKENPTKSNEIYIDRLTPDLSNDLETIDDDLQRVDRLIKELVPFPINLTL